jgi:hypothetical protein
VTHTLLIRIPGVVIHTLLVIIPGLVVHAPLATPDLVAPHSNTVIIIPGLVIHTLFIIPGLVIHTQFAISPGLVVRYHEDGSKKLNACSLFFLWMVYF